MIPASKGSSWGYRGISPRTAYHGCVPDINKQIMVLGPILPPTIPGYLCSSLAFSPQTARLDQLLQHSRNKVFGVSENGVPQNHSRSICWWAQVPSFQVETHFMCWLCRVMPLYGPIQPYSYVNIPIPNMCVAHYPHLTPIWFLSKTVTPV